MSPDSTPHPSICEARGWWALYHYEDHTVRRVRIAAWMTVHENTEDSDYIYPQAMVTGDGPDLTPANWTKKFMMLWHDGDSYCHCAEGPRPWTITDDIWWCEDCIGEIHR